MHSDSASQRLCTQGGDWGPAETIADEMARTALEMPETFLASRTKNSAEARVKAFVDGILGEIRLVFVLNLMRVPVSHRWHQSYNWEELGKDWTLLYCLCASIGHGMAMLLWYTWIPYPPRFLCSEFGHRVEL